MTDFDEIEALRRISEAFDNLDDNAKDRVLIWATAKYGRGLALSNTTIESPGRSISSAESLEEDTTKTSGFATKQKRKTRKPKTVIKIDKSLDLSPAGKLSAAQFSSEKSPSNAKAKGLVACYYIREILGREVVGVEQVAAFFKGVGWALPADLKNVLQQAGSEGWLDTADSHDIKITSAGETTVEHRLPPSK